MYMNPSVSATFSPNDKYVLLSCVDSKLCIWCLEHNTIEKVFNVVNSGVGKV